MQTEEGLDYHATIEEALNGNPGDLVIITAHITQPQRVRINNGWTAFEVHDYSGPGSKKRSIPVMGMIKALEWPKLGGFVVIRGGLMEVKDIRALAAAELTEVPRPPFWPKLWPKL